MLSTSMLVFVLASMCMMVWGIGTYSYILQMFYMQGYKHKKTFIVAEGPMQSTVRNFWKMIYERNCAVVVMTSSLVEGGQEASAQYWPDSETAYYGELAVDLLGEEKLEGFIIRNLSTSVMDAKV